MPQYEVDRTRLETGPPAPWTVDAPGLSAAPVTTDPVVIEPEKASGYANLPTTVTQLFDGPTRPLGLADVVVETLANDRRIKVQAYTLRIAEMEVPVSKGIYDLVASWQASYTRSEVQSSLVGFARLPESSSRQRALQAALSQLFPTGAIVSLAYNVARNSNLTQSFSGLQAMPIWEITYPHRATLSVTQPLLRGFGPSITNAGIRVAQIERQGAAADFQVQVESRLAGALQTYWELLGAVETYKVQVISFSAALDLLRVNRAKFEQGVLPSTDVLQAEAAVEARRNLVIQARQSVRDLEDDLKRQIFLRDSSPQWELQIQPTQPIAWRPVEVDLGQTIDVALAQRAELRRADSNIEQAQEGLRVADNNRLPELNLFGSANTNGLGGGFDEGFHNMTSGIYAGYSAGLEFVYPLQNRTARYRRRQAEARVDQATELRLDAVDQVTLEVRQAVRALRTARQQIETTQSGVRSEEAKLSAEMRRYEVGLSTLYQVLLFQNDLATAQSSHIDAVVRYNQALVQLERARGGLLGSYGVDVSGAELRPPNPPVGFPVGGNE
jgi:outer membrane protein TolC